MHAEFWKAVTWRPRSRWKGSINKGVMEAGGENERWMELSQDRTQWRDLVLMALDHRILQSESYSILYSFTE
jgi:hypothetical protein